MAAPQNKSQVPVGTVLEEKFRITREIGRGGMAAVYEAENILLGKRVAVKILAAELITSRVVRERFLREARAAAAIRSPYICDVYDSGMYDGRPFLVMELLEGESLYDLMTRVRRLDAARTVEIMTQAARGLAKAHESKVIHRDLKPENIFITKGEDGATVAKILDFGLAKFYETKTDAAQTRLTREGALFGTPAYMSPEQAKGQGEVDHRADLWALGCIVYECLTGTTVWNVDQGVAMILAQIAGAPVPKPSKLRPDLPESFEIWFAKALERDPNKRFQTAKEFAESLTQALAPGSPVEIPAWRKSSVPSAEESALVDELVEASGKDAKTVPPTAKASKPTSGSRTKDLPDQVVSVPPPRPTSPARALRVVAAVAALALVVFAAWRMDLLPTGRRPGVAVDAGPPASVSAASSAPAAPEPMVPLEKEPVGMQIGKAQELLRDGKRDEALVAFKEAFNNGGSGVARGVLNHAAIGIPATEGKCKLSGLGRPRPFELSSATSRPSIVMTPHGPVAAWVDNHQDAARRQAFTSTLDDALRRISPARLVTPEASSVRLPELVALEGKLVLLYWEDSGNEPGVYVRLLETDGRIAGPAKRVSGVLRHEFYPGIERAEDGSFWVVWDQEGDHGSDIHARHLSAELDPIGEPLRLTAFASKKKGTSNHATRPDLAISDGQLNVVFALEQDKKRRIMLLQIPVTDEALKTGIVTPDAGTAKPEQVVGHVTPVSNTEGKSSSPRIACDSVGCYVVWDDEKAGVMAAFVDKKKGQTLWHREFARSGAAPEVAAAKTGVMVAWYEGARLKIAAMTRDGVDAGSVLAKVGGFQPYPSITAGGAPGQWYISWRDYESGHFEAYVVRAQCQ